ncbi:membrane associated rhomboid family serine protease [Amorphus suaedae]
MSLSDRPRGEPMFTIPSTVVWLTAVLVVIHLVRTMLLSYEADVGVLLLFAFIPARYAGDILSAYMPTGPVSWWGLMNQGAAIWSFLTYAFLHGNVTHLLVNCLWLVAFGSALARRFGAVRFLAFSAVGAVAGAAIHLALHFGDMVPVIGASAAISAQMAAAARFVFQSGAPLGAFRVPDDRAYRVPALTLVQTLRSARPMMFVGVWFGINLLVGLGSASIIGGGEVIAWEAHIGGFLAGLLLFRFFDPVGPLPLRRADDGWRA